jgi:Glycosyltransferase like family
MNVYIGFCTTATSYLDLKNRSKYTIVNSESLNEITSSNGVYNNTVSIAKIYNSYIESYKNKDCILVLAHDDVLITDKNWINKVKQGLEKYDIIGLAGGSNAAIRQPCLWHLMCPRETHSGTVGHTIDNKIFKTHFGKPGRVLLLDGLFLAFNPKKIFEAGVKFDESCASKFHFYDIDFSLQCNKAKLKLGTFNIDVVHASPGLKSYNREFLEGQDWFINKFNRGEY